MWDKLAVLGLAVVFAWSAAAKSLRWRSWTSLVAGYRLGPLTGPARVGVPIAEAGIVAALLLGTERLGAALALVALVVFSIAILRLRTIEGDRLPCGCFGVARRRDYRFSLARNVALALLAALVMARSPDIYEGFSMPEGSELLPAALIVSGLLVAAWLGTTVARSFRKGSDS